MNQTVLLNISGTQSDTDGASESVDLSTQAVLVRNDDGSIKIEYAESELTGMEGTSTRLYITDGKVEIERTGAYQSLMIFEQNKAYNALYDTPYGKFTMRILPSTVTTTLDEKSVDVSIVYDYNLGAMAGQNSLRMTTKLT